MDRQPPPRILPGEEALMPTYESPGRMTRARRARAGKTHARGRSGSTGPSGRANLSPPRVGRPRALSSGPRSRLGSSATHAPPAPGAGANVRLGTPTGGRRSRASSTSSNLPKLDNAPPTPSEEELTAAFDKAHLKAPGRRRHNSVGPLSLTQTVPAAKPLAPASPTAAAFAPQPLVAAARERRQQPGTPTSEASGRSSRGAVSMALGSGWHTPRSAGSLGAGSALPSPKFAGEDAASTPQISVQWVTQDLASAYPSRGVGAMPEGVMPSMAELSVSSFNTEGVCGADLHRPGGADAVENTVPQDVLRRRRASTLLPVSTSAFLPAKAAQPTTPTRLRPMPATPEASSSPPKTIGHYKTRIGAFASDMKSLLQRSGKAKEKDGEVWDFHAVKGSPGSEDALYLPPPDMEPSTSPQVVLKLPRVGAREQRRDGGLSLDWEGGAGNMEPAAPQTPPSPACSSAPGDMEARLQTLRQVQMDMSDRPLPPVPPRSGPASLASCASDPGGPDPDVLLQQFGALACMVEEECASSSHSNGGAATLPQGERKPSSWESADPSAGDMEVDLLMSPSVAGLDGPLDISEGAKPAAGNAASSKAVRGPDNMEVDLQMSPSVAGLDDNMEVDGDAPARAPRPRGVRAAPLPEDDEDDLPVKAVRQLRGKRGEKARREGSGHVEAAEQPEAAGRKRGIRAAPMEDAEDDLEALARRGRGWGKRGVPRDDAGNMELAGDDGNALIREAGGLRRATRRPRDRGLRSTSSRKRLQDWVDGKDSKAFPRAQGGEEGSAARRDSSRGLQPWDGWMPSSRGRRAERAADGDGAASRARQMRGHHGRTQREGGNAGAADDAEDSEDVIPTQAARAGSGHRQRRVSAGAKANDDNMELAGDDDATARAAAPQVRGHRSRSRRNSDNMAVAEVETDDEIPTQAARGKRGTRRVSADAKANDDNMELAGDDDAAARAAPAPQVRGHRSRSRRNSDNMAVAEVETDDEIPTQAARGKRGTRRVSADAKANGDNMELAEDDDAAARAAPQVRGHRSRSRRNSDNMAVAEVETDDEIPTQAARGKRGTRRVSAGAKANGDNMELAGDVPASKRNRAGHISGVPSAVRVEDVSAEKEANDDNDDATARAAPQVRGHRSRSRRNSDNMAVAEVETDDEIPTQAARGKRGTRRVSADAKANDDNMELAEDVPASKRNRGGRISGVPSAVRVLRDHPDCEDNMEVADDGAPSQAASTAGEDNMSVGSNAISEESASPKGLGCHLLATAGGTPTTLTPTTADPTTADPSWMLSPMTDDDPAVLSNVRGHRSGRRRCRLGDAPMAYSPTSPAASSSVQFEEAESSGGNASGEFSKSLLTFADLSGLLEEEGVSLGRPSPPGRHLGVQSSPRPRPRPGTSEELSCQSTARQGSDNMEVACDLDDEAAAAAGARLPRRIQRVASHMSLYSFASEPYGHDDESSDIDDGPAPAHLSRPPTGRLGRKHSVSARQNSLMRAASMRSCLSAGSAMGLTRLASEGSLKSPFGENLALDDDLEAIQHSTMMEFRLEPSAPEEPAAQGWVQNKDQVRGTKTKRRRRMRPLNLALPEGQGVARDEVRFLLDPAKLNLPRGSPLQEHNPAHEVLELCPTRPHNHPDWSVCPITGAVNIRGIRIGRARELAAVARGGSGGAVIDMDGDDDEDEIPWRRRQSGTRLRRGGKVARPKFEFDPMEAGSDDDAGLMELCSDDQGGAAAPKPLRMALDAAGTVLEGDCPCCAARVRKELRRGGRLDRPGFDFDGRRVEYDSDEGLMEVCPDGSAVPVAALTADAACPSCKKPVVMKLRRGGRAPRPGFEFDSSCEELYGSEDGAMEHDPNDIRGYGRKRPRSVGWYEPGSGQSPEMRPRGPATRRGRGKRPSFEFDGSEEEEEEEEDGPGAPGRGRRGPAWKSGRVQRPGFEFDGSDGGDDNEAHDGLMELVPGDGAPWRVDKKTGEVEVAGIHLGWKVKRSPLPKSALKKRVRIGGFETSTFDAESPPVTKRARLMLFDEACTVRTNKELSPREPHIVRYPSLPGVSIGDGMSVYDLDYNRKLTLMELLEDVGAASVVSTVDSLREDYLTTPEHDDLDLPDGRSMFAHKFQASLYI